jgi:aminomethyltransferase
MIDMGLRTALYESHIALNARMIDFGGWEMPLQYEGVLAEHASVRNDAGIFDTSHMNAFWISGPDSLDALSRLVTQDLRTLAVGACRYGFLLNEDAGVIDDLIVYRMSETEWMPVVNAGTAVAVLAWIRQHCDNARVTIKDLRDIQGKLDIQGPNAITIIKRIFDLDFSDLKRFRWTRVENNNEPWIVSRTGYTGADGVEIYPPAASMGRIWQALTEAGVRPCGLGARDTLRLEAGFPLNGHEFDPATSPAEAGMMRYCSKAEPFIGKEALMRRAAAPARLLAPFLLEGRQTARHGQSVVLENGDQIGKVTSGSFCPTVGRALGFAYVTPANALPDTRCFIDNGRTLLPATVTTLPFLKT